MKMPDEPQLLNVTKAASFLGVSTSTIRKWTYAKRLQAVKIGSRGDWRFSKDELLKMLKMSGEGTKSLEEDNIKIKNFLENASVGIHWVGPDGTILWANKTELEMMGYTPEEYIGHKVQEFHVDQDVIGDILTRLTNKEILKSYEARLRCKDGSIKYVSINSSVLWKNGRFIHTRCFTADINDLKKAEKAVEAEREKYYSVLMQAPMPIAIVKGPNHVYELSNPANTQALGERVIIGKSVKELFPEAEKQGILQILDKVYTTGEPFYGNEVPFEIVIPGKGPQTNYVNLTYQPLKDINNKVERIMVVAYDVTEQVKARQKAEENEKQLHLITDALPVLISYVDFKQRYQFNNKAYEDWFGHSRKSIYGKHLKDVLGPKAYEAVRPYVEKVLSGQTANYETSIPYKDGGERFVQASYIPHFGDKGKVGGFYALVTDISERKKVEESLRESKERLRVMFDSAVVGVATLTLKAQFLEVNKSFCRIVGYSKRELLEMDCSALTHPAYIDSTNKLVEDLIAGKVPPFVLEKKYLKKDRTEIWVQNSVSLVRDEYGKPLHLVAICQDVTERKKAEEIMRYHTNLIKTVSDAIISTDMNYVIKTWNKGAEELYGWKEKEAVGKSLRGVVQTDFADPKDLEESQKKLLTTGIWQGEVTHRGKRGEPLSILASVSLVKDSVGKPIGIVAVNRDISERKKLDQRKDEFIGIASHELKTPVTSLKTFTQVIEKRFKKIGDVQSERVLGQMDKQINKLTNLVDELLNVSRIQAGKLQYKKQEFAIDDLVEETVHNLQRASNSHKIIMDGQTRQKAFADRNRIEQVLINIINNAVKYSPEFDKVIVSSRKNGKEVVIGVEDFGIGIPKEEHEKIFERFYQANSDRRGNTYAGLGVGLYISKEIIERHEGKIWIESKKGKGTKFCFSLPVAAKS